MYIGRFAPSPTGPLHMGSLVAAVGSYLRAKQQGGQWLLRMEDLDPLREVPGAADSILRTLEAHGLYWDQSVVYQSKRTDYYHDAFQILMANHDLYACRCTRKALKQTARVGQCGIIYPGNCRHRNYAFTGRHAVRIKTDNTLICFYDKCFGKQCQRLADEVGDFIIKRSDGYFSYQLAVVVDDHLQRITEVVRGEDLLNNTQRQIYLHQRLGYAQPGYLHLPLVTNEAGQKLSKQTHAPALVDTEASFNLVQALTLLASGITGKGMTGNTENLTKSQKLHQESHRIITHALTNKLPDLQLETPESILTWGIENISLTAAPEIL